MIATMNVLTMERREQPPPEGVPQDPHRALLAMPTQQIKLSPEFVQALVKVAPKRRRHKLPYILGLAVIVAAGSLAVVPSARHRVAAAAYRLLHGAQPVAAVVPSAPASVQPTASAEASPALASTQPIVIPPVVISSAAPDTGSSSAKPSKPPRKWHRAPPR